MDHHNKVQAHEQNEMQKRHANDQVELQKRQMEDQNNRHELSSKVLGYRQVYF